MTTLAVKGSRDADRSREAILAAAESLFAERGFEGTSLQEIATASGLSRGTPSYFFGSKDGLYMAVLERVFAARQAATEAAFAPVREWCAGTGGVPELTAALTAAVRDYMAFVASHPTFPALIMREELAGGARIHARRGRSMAVEDAFASVRRAGPRRGLAPFRVRDAVLLFIALVFAPASYATTLMRAVGRDLNEPAVRRAHVRLAVDQLMHLLTR